MSAATIRRMLNLDDTSCVVLTESISDPFGRLVIGDLHRDYDRAIEWGVTTILRAGLTGFGV